MPQQVLIEFNIQSRWWENSISSQRELLNKFVLYTFSQYETLNLENYNLWDAIQVDYENWKEEHFNQLSESTWKFLRQHCYTHGFWLKETSATTSATSMLQAINSKPYEDWTMNQIRWIEERWNRLSKRMIKRKQRLINSDSLVSAIQPANVPVIQPPPLAISVNQSSQQAPSIIQIAAPISIKQAISSLIQQAPEQAPDQAPPQAPPQASPQAPDQTLPQAPDQALPQASPQAPDQAITENAAPFINQNVTLTPNQNVAPNPIQNAALKQAAPINQNAAPKQATSISQNAVLIASLFKKKVFQSISQHLIVCLIITISTLPARGIGWVETKGMGDSWDGLDTLSFHQTKEVPVLVQPNVASQSRDSQWWITFI